VSAVIPFGAGLARKGRFHERNQYFFQFPHRAVYDLSAVPDAQVETPARRGPVTKDVPIVRIDHVSTQGTLPGMRHAFSVAGDGDFKGMKR
jgi:hypothetical protein